jgi:hypothetical protein
MRLYEFGKIEIALKAELAGYAKDGMTLFTAIQLILNISQ